MYLLTITTSQYKLLTFIHHNSRKEVQLPQERKYTSNRVN